MSMTSQINFQQLVERFEHIILTDLASLPKYQLLGLSREKRQIAGYRIGSGALKVSLIAGCHADEPVGPHFLRHLVAHLSRCDEHDPLLSEIEWWIVPHANPDGEQRNLAWHSSELDYQLARYLLYAEREAPGDDMEFGFPRENSDIDARPENRAIYRWWSEEGSLFHVHGSLHGMAIAGGPWFLLEPRWSDRLEQLMQYCIDASAALGYSLHDVERGGEKGFLRIARGFCTCPNSKAMAEYFLSKGDSHTAGLFRPSSMETIRSLGGDPLCFVSEMPLFIAPGMGDDIGPPDLVASRWQKRIADWKTELDQGAKPEDVEENAARFGLLVMPPKDQMRLQWTLIAAAIDRARSSLAINSGN